MSGILHDTFFALIVRALLGPTYFSHIDEVNSKLNPRTVYSSQDPAKMIAPSELTLGHGIDDQDDPLNARGRGFGAYDEVEAQLTPSRALQSSVTIVAVAEPPKPTKEVSDPFLITWDGPDDPEVCRTYQSFTPLVDFLAKNPMNWSQFKKTLVMFQVCLLTFAVYIGGAVYTAGIPDVSEQFHVSNVAATLGLSLFVAGYGIGASF